MVAYLCNQAPGRLRQGAGEFETRATEKMKPVQKDQSKAGKMAQCVNILATKTKSLSLIPTIHMVE